MFAQDLAQPGAGKQLIDRAQSGFGELDILVTNALVQVTGRFEEVTQEEFELQISVNLRSTFDMLQAVLPRMATRGWGRLVNVGSITQRGHVSSGRLLTMLRILISPLIRQPPGKAQ